MFHVNEDSRGRGLWEGNVVTLGVCSPFYRLGVSGGGRRERLRWEEGWFETSPYSLVGGTSQPRPAVGSRLRRNKGGWGTGGWVADIFGVNW